MPPDQLPSVDVTSSAALTARPVDAGAAPVHVVREDGSVLCERCTVAQTPRARMRGLLGRRALPRGEGILLRPAPSIHTFFMRFPIDVVFLDWDLRVLRADENVRPWRFAGCRGARNVLELAAGEVRRRGVEPGQQLRLHDLRQERVGAPGPRADHRVLVAGRDRRFLRVTSYLLARAGFAVETTRVPAEVLEMLDRERADVVIVDATDDMTSTARTIAAVQALHGDVAMLVVAERSRSQDLGSIHVLPKWSPFDELEEAIANALETSRQPRAASGIA